MKCIRRGIVLFGIMASATGMMLAQGAAAPAVAGPAGPLKVGVLNVQAIVLYSNEGQRDFGVLNQKYAPKQAQLKSLSDEIAAAQKSLQDAGDKLSDTERTSRTHSIETKQRDLQRSAEDAQNDYQGEQQVIFQRIGQKLETFIQTYAAQNSYSLLIEAGSQTSPVVYANQGLDVTKAVLDGYNTSSGVPAPPAPAGGAATTPTVPRTTPRTTAPPATAPK